TGLDARATAADVRGQVLASLGVLPSLLDPGTTAQAVREGQRHLAMWTLQPIADRIGQEIKRKTGQDVLLDVVEGSRAYDAPGLARALHVRIKAIADAKEAGLSEAEIQAALSGGVYDAMRD